MMRAFALFLLLILPSLATAYTPASDSLPWKPFPQALEEAQARKVKTLVFIYTDWCPWCQKIQREVFTDSTIAAMMTEHFSLTKLDAESKELIRFMGEDVEMRVLAQALGGEGFPTITFLTSEGKYITRLPGFVPAEVFKHVLDYIAEEAYTEQSFEAFMSAQNQ